ncbi:hypothetical protein BSL78_16058 [Apostichopus japonicus]|uniref:EGF-like domain-containing protein n=1 Tax=Stichopus japonicus TaxID=307972 RepID=A0A2G8KGE6_STIJA|nr:hypothetical protein BSL78_16058 [Apostichopus japonicus]
MVEASYQCSDHATCDERNGVRKCYCNQNYNGEGVTCIHNCFVAAKKSVLREGEFYVNSRCTQNSTCRNNQIIEADYQCSDHATCDMRNSVRKCYCNQNYEGNGVTCIHNCFVAAKGSVLMEGEFYVNSRCTRRSTCRNNQILKVSYQCSDHATCAERNGVRKCYCNQNYHGDGVTCTHNCFVADIGSILMEGESYINSDCSLRITCNSNVLTSESYSCSADATCEERNDVRRCYCNEWFEGNGLTCTRSGPVDCTDLFAANRTNNGKYIIYPAESSGFEVYCEMSSGGWTVITQWEQIQDIDLVRTMKTMMNRVTSTAQKNTEVAGGIQAIVIRALPATATHSATALLDTSTLTVAATICVLLLRIVVYFLIIIVITPIIVLMIVVNINAQIAMAVAVLTIIDAAQTKAGLMQQLSIPAVTPILTVNTRPTITAEYSGRIFMVLIAVSQQQQ